MKEYICTITPVIRRLNLKYLKFYLEFYYADILTSVMYMRYQKMCFIYSVLFSEYNHRCRLWRQSFTTTSIGSVHAKCDFIGLNIPI